MTAREHFEALYGAHAGAVLAYARRRTTPGDAEDVLNEVFLVAWRRLDEVPRDARIWLLGVARRVLANQRRGDARQRALRQRLSGEQPGFQAPHRARDERVLRALTSLGENDREALLLLGWEQLSHREAARVLGIRPRAFSVRLHRAPRVSPRRSSPTATRCPTPPRRPSQWRPDDPFQDDRARTRRQPAAGGSLAAAGRGAACPP